MGGRRSGTFCVYLGGWQAFVGEPPFCTRWRPGLTPRGLEVRGSGDPAGDRAWPTPPHPPGRIPRPLAREGGRGAASPGLAQTQLGFLLLRSARGPLASPARNQELMLGSGRNSWSVGSWASPGSLGPDAGEAAGSPLAPRRTAPHTCSSRARPRGPGDGGDAGRRQRGETRRSPARAGGGAQPARGMLGDARRRALSAAAPSPGPPDGTPRLLGGFSPGGSSTFSMQLGGHHSRWGLLPLRVR